MYFIITGQHKHIIEEALLYLHPTNIYWYKSGIITFDTLYPERLSTAWFIIKRGKVCNNKELSDKTLWYSLLWSSSKDTAMMLKRQLPHIKRFKLVDLIHTDIEIKNEWKEIVNIDGKNRWIVEWYQNISLYETIDFQKPVGGMTIGMMPSKLAHTLINIGVGEYETKQGKNQNPHSLTIRDPFCGFGTTNFLANTLQYNTIWSDLNSTSIKQNLKWRYTTSYYHEDNRMTVVKQDVKEIFDSPFFRYADIIVSEWRLWHIITNATWPKEAENSSLAVEGLYKSFFDNLSFFLQKNKKHLTLVMTIPVWIKHNHNFSVSESIKDHSISLGRQARLIKDPYSRPWQLVGRQIFIASI